MTAAFHARLPNPVQKKNENQMVKTPAPLVFNMCESFPKDVWSNPRLKWLVPVSKNGEFELELFRRLMMGLIVAIPDYEERRNWIVNEMIYSFAPTPACELIVRRNYLGKVWNNMRGFLTLKGNVQTRDFLKARLGKNGEVMVKKEANGKETYVKFDCIVGNPPYQLSDGAGGGGASAGALYPDFVQKATECNPSYLSMVIPAPWMTGNGKSTSSFLKMMLSCKKLTNIVSTEKSEDWFPGVLIPGGVMYFMWEASKNDHVVKINGKDMNLEGQEVILVVGVTIRDKVVAKCDTFFESKMLLSNPYGLRSNYSDWSDDFETSYVCHVKGGSGGGEMTKLVNKKHIAKNLDTIDKWKLCIPKAYGAERGSTGKTFIVKPGNIVSETYLVIGVFDTNEEVKNAEAFINTYLVQYLVSLLKVKNTSSKTFKFVPYLDFTRSYSNEDLYAMFDLSKEEIEHVEKTTRNYIVFRSKGNKPAKAPKAKAEKKQRQPKTSRDFDRLANVINLDDV
jgi:site-specific DNA-methyltransferase (adenine-specific)